MHLATNSLPESEILQHHLTILNTGKIGIRILIRRNTRSFIWYSDKTDHGQNVPVKTDHVSGENGPRLRTKRTTFLDKTDQASGQNGPRLRTKRTTFLDKTDQASGQNRPGLVFITRLKSPIHTKYNLHCIELECSSSAKYLGVTISLGSLHQKTSFGVLKIKASQTLSFIKRIIRIQKSTACIKF